MKYVNKYIMLISLSFFGNLISMDQGKMETESVVQIIITLLQYKLGKIQSPRDQVYIIELFKRKSADELAHELTQDWLEDLRKIHTQNPEQCNQFKNEFLKQKMIEQQEKIDNRYRSIPGASTHKEIVKRRR
ncbi:MAG: hypothetical protein WD055_05965 [Candidatus Dependentiae bacterium]